MGGSDAAGASATPLEIPDWMRAVFVHFLTAEVSTVSRSGAPSTAPLGVSYEAETGRFRTTTCVAFPQKAYNLRRDPTISLLYSYPVGSGLAAPTPVVLVQGRAALEDDFVENRRRFEAEVERWLEAQPAFGAIWYSPFWRWLYRYYLLRIFIAIRPIRMLGWEDGDLTRPPVEVPIESGATAASAPVSMRVDTPLRLPARAARRLERLGHGAFSVREPDTGLIHSVPCRCRAMPEDGPVVVHIPPGCVAARPEPYPASLCFHTHNAALADIGQQLCTGTAMVAPDGTVVFHPAWTAGFDMTGGLTGRLLFGAVTRVKGARYFRRRPGPTADMIPSPTRS